VRAVRRRLLVALALVTPLGLLAKAWPGPGAACMRDHGAGLLYVVFWILALRLAAPRLRAATAASAVFAATCALELLQLWHPPALEAVRATWLGRALLGSTFSWGDFPAYAIGAVAGAGLLRALQSGTEARKSEPDPRTS
jgi:hypothetical protein